MKICLRIFGLQIQQSQLLFKNKKFPNSMSQHYHHLSRLNQHQSMMHSIPIWMLLFKVIIQPTHFLHTAIQWQLKLNHPIQIIDNQRYSLLNVVPIHSMMISYDDEQAHVSIRTLFLLCLSFLLAHTYCCLLFSNNPFHFLFLVITIFSSLSLSLSLSLSFVY